MSCWNSAQAVPYQTNDPAEFYIWMARMRHPFGERPRSSQYWPQSFVVLQHCARDSRPGARAIRRKVRERHNQNNPAPEDICLELEDRVLLRRWYEAWHKETFPGRACVIDLVPVKALDLHHGCRFRRGARKSNIPFVPWTIGLTAQDRVSR